MMRLRFSHTTILDLLFIHIILCTASNNMHLLISTVSISSIYNMIKSIYSCNFLLFIFILSITLLPLISSFSPNDSTHPTPTLLIGPKKLLGGLSPSNSPNNGANSYYNSTLPNGETVSHGMASVLLFVILLIIFLTVGRTFCTRRSRTGYEIIPN